MLLITLQCSSLRHKFADSTLFVVAVSSVAEMNEAATAFVGCAVDLHLSLSITFKN